MNNRRFVKQSTAAGIAPPPVTKPFSEDSSCEWPSVYQEASLALESPSQNQVLLRASSGHHRVGSITAFGSSTALVKCSDSRIKS